MKQIALIGPTASGKSEAALALAQKVNAYIFSIDSLSIYKEINIASAKPSKDELLAVRHFGIDYLTPSEKNSAGVFFSLYQEAKSLCEKEGKNLVITGGSAFYLKSMTEGLSEDITPDSNTESLVLEKIKDLPGAYAELQTIDPIYAKNIAANDTYRITKALNIYYAVNLPPSEYFLKNKKKPLIENLKIYKLEVDRELLRRRIAVRTDKMIENGLIEEVCALEKKYTRNREWMKSIGIKEVLQYLDGEFGLKDLADKISTNTAQLAKRQRTFNKTQFPEGIPITLEEFRSLSPQIVFDM